MITNKINTAAQSVIPDLNLSFEPIYHGEKVSIVIDGAFPTHSETTVLLLIEFVTIEISGLYYVPYTEDFFEAISKPTRRIYNIALHQLHQKAFDSYALFFELKSHGLDSMDWYDKFTFCLDSILNFADKGFCIDYVRFWRELTARISGIFEHSIKTGEQHDFALHFDRSIHREILAINDRLKQIADGHEINLRYYQE